jgi:hypothetical protein
MFESVFEHCSGQAHGVVFWLDQGKHVSLHMNVLFLFDEAGRCFEVDGMLGCVCDDVCDVFFVRVRTLKEIYPIDKGLFRLFQYNGFVFRYHYVDTIMKIVAREQFQKSKSLD